MDFYLITEGRDQVYYNIVGGPIAQYLPSVQNPECGHKIYSGGGQVLPISATAIPGIEKYLKRARNSDSISPEEWATLAELVAKATSGTACSHMPVSPAMRLGPVDIVYTCRKEIPDVMWIPGSYMFSDRLLRQLGPMKDIHVYPVSAHRKSAKQSVEQTAFYELLPTLTAKFAPVCEYQCTRCDICGQIISVSYRHVILDMAGMDDVDVVRTEYGKIYYSERFKQKFESAGVRGLTFIPGWRMSSESDPSSILYDMEFERQTGRPPDVTRPAS